MHSVTDLVSQTPLLIFKTSICVMSLPTIKPMFWTTFISILYVTTTKKPIYSYYFVLHPMVIKYQIQACASLSFSRYIEWKMCSGTQERGLVHQLWSNTCSFFVRCYHMSLTSSSWTISLHGLNVRSAIMFTILNTVQNLLLEILIASENAVRKLTKASRYNLKCQKTEKTCCADKTVIYSET